MLFLFPRENRVSLWMKDTWLSLDMLFLDKKGKIVYIKENAEPNSTDFIGPEVPVRAALELRGGSADRHDIKVGDYVVYPAFKK
jgi:uncharacterized membrane protein (UPF0127 family)